MMLYFQPRRLRQWALCMALGCTLASVAGLSQAAPEQALASDSIYQLDVPLTRQDGQAMRLADKRGKPVLISMFYTSCQFACPMLITAMKDTLAKLDVQEQQGLQLVLVSFDPAHDTVAVLQRTAQQHELSSTQWTLANSDAANTRKLAAVLGIQYRALKNGDFNHTTAIILLDGAGRKLAQTSQLGVADPKFLKRVRAALRGDGA